jgi:protein TonB
LPAALPRLPLSPAPRSARRAGVLAAIALHVGVATAVLAYEPVRSTLSAPATIAVEWIAAPRVEAPAPEPTPVKAAPKPKPLRHAAPLRSEPPPIAAAPTPAPAAEPVAEAAPPPPPAPAAAPMAAIEPTPAPAPVVVTPPVFNADYLANPAPPYPPLSRRIGEQGRVVLRVHVTPGGTVDEAQVRTSSGHARLDDSALETVKRWNFVPAKRGAEPVAAWVLVPISFGLES